MSNLITKYRPQTLADVIGQDAVVRSLQSIAKKQDTQCFLFSGPSGCGKTTLSGIMAGLYGVDPKSVIDFDAADKTGVDDVRMLKEILQYRPFGEEGKRAVIIDECHRLSGNAFDSLLKALETPPKHIVWFFCTTNPAKVPTTIKTRCTKFDLKAVDDKGLGELYDYVCEQEKIDLPGDVGDLLIREAKGSPRQLLSNIVVGRTAKTKKEAAILLQTAVQDDPTLALCQFIANGNGSWSKCMGLLAKLEDANPESVRILACNYLASCLKNSKTDADAVIFMQRLDAFAAPYNGAEGLAPLLLSIGRALFSE